MAVAITLPVDDTTSAFCTSWGDTRRGAPQAPYPSVAVKEPTSWVTPSSVTTSQVTFPSVHESARVTIIQGLDPP